MSDTFDKFTESARRVLTLAQEEAQRLGHNYIGTEHLLLGLAREGDGVAARVLGNLGAPLPKVRSAVEFIIGRGESMVMGEIGLTPRAKRVIELAADEARRLNHHYIGTEHLLLGLVREGEGIAAGVLGSLGVDLEQTRAQVLQTLRAPGGARAEANIVSVMPSAARLPDLRDLIRVYSIGQTAGRGAVEVLALALEVYTTGFIVTLQIQSAGQSAGGQGGAAPFGGGPIDLPLVASDDRGAGTRASGSAGAAVAGRSCGSGGRRAPSARRSIRRRASCGSRRRPSNCRAPTRHRAVWRRWGRSPGRGRSRSRCRRRAMRARSGKVASGGVVTGWVVWVGPLPRPLPYEGRGAPPGRPRPTAV